MTTTKAACAPENNPPIDLASVDADASQADVDLARSVCLACPVLHKCAPMVRRMRVAGVAGGMTERERKDWQNRQHLDPDDTDLVDVTPARQITSAILDDLPKSKGEIHPKVRALVLRMTAAGMSALQIVDLLARPEVTERTVNYLRRTYMKEWARVSDVD